MRSINATIVTHLEGTELRVFKLLHMDIDSTDYYYTNCDVPIVYGGNTYEPRGFNADVVSYSTDKIVDQVQLELDNNDETLTPVFVGGTPQGSDVTLSFVTLDSDYAIIASSSVTAFQGELGEWLLDEGSVRCTVTNQFAQWTQETINNHSASCRWKVFGGTECTYAGAEVWCDRSYTRCTALSNVANFGGFRWLPSIENKVIWWGSTPKE